MSSNVIPVNYTTPPFPSITFNTNVTYYLYRTEDFWRFIAFWNLFLTVSIYGVMSLWAYFVFRKHPLAFLFPIIFPLYGALSSFLAGSVIGLMLSAIYQAGEFKMMTNWALVWAMTYVILQLLSTFSTMTTIL